MKLIPVLVLPVVAVILGIVYAIADANRTILFLTPLIFALGLAIGTAWGIWFSQLHHLLDIVLLVILNGILMFASLQIARYLLSGYEGTLRDFLADYFYYGFVITSTTNPLGNQTGQVETILYWLLDGVMFIGFPLYFAVQAVRRPFCDHCQRYYGIASLGRDKANAIQVGAVPLGQAVAFNQTLSAKDYTAAAAMIVPTTQDSSDQYTHAHLFGEFCPTCETSPVYFDIERLVGQGANRKMESMGRHTLTYDQFKRLRTPNMMRGRDLNAQIRGLLIVWGVGIALLMGWSQIF